MNTNFDLIDEQLKDLIRVMLLPNDERIKLDQVMRILTNSDAIVELGLIAT